MTVPLVSVVMPNYNNSDFLTESISSILIQDYPNFELIFVDDNSSDDSLGVINSYFPQVKVIPHKINKGVNSARNSGILEAAGELIALCDSDDIWKPHKLSKQVDLLKRLNTTRLVYSDVQYFDSLSGKVRVTKGSMRGNLGKMYKLYPSVAWAVGGGSTTLFYKSDAVNVGLFDENLGGSGEDWEFFARLSQVGDFDFVDEVLVLCRVHAGSRSQIGVRKWLLDNKEALKASQSKNLNWRAIERIASYYNLEKFFFKSCLRDKDYRSLFWRLLNRKAFDDEN